MAGKKKKRLIIVTGKTKRQMIDEMRTMGFVEKQGIQPVEVKGCYLCKREEGEETVLLPEGDDETIHLPPIKLRLYEVDMTDGVRFGYWLCNECAVLLSELGGVVSESEQG